MTVFRKITNSEIVSQVMDLPDGLKNKEVEIIIFPHENHDKDKDKNEDKNARGLLEKYKNENLYSLESEAWAEAVKEKNEHSWC